MGRYCRKIEGKYFGVLAHAHNGWQEHKYEADDDERMKEWWSWPSSTWSRFEIGIDLDAARVAASATSHRSLLTSRSLLAVHIALCDLLTAHFGLFTSLLHHHFDYHLYFDQHKLIPWLMSCSVKWAKSYLPCQPYEGLPNFAKLGTILNLLLNAGHYWI